MPEVRRRGHLSPRLPRPRPGGSVGMDPALPRPRPRPRPPVAAALPAPAVTSTFGTLEVPAADLRGFAGDGLALTGDALTLALAFALAFALPFVLCRGGWPARFGEAPPATNSPESSIDFLLVDWRFLVDGAFAAFVAAALLRRPFWPVPTDEAAGGSTAIGFEELRRPRDCPAGGTGTSGVPPLETMERRS